MTLPTELLPHAFHSVLSKNLSTSTNFIIPSRKICGQGRIRTSEGMSRQIYSLMRLTTSLPAQQLCSIQRLRFSKRMIIFTSFNELAIGLEPMTC